MKTCARCKMDKPITGFNKCASKKDGLHSYCRVCNSEVRNKWRTDHPDKTLEHTRSQRTKNPLAAFAHCKLDHCVERGKIERPNKCQLCEKECKPHGHHSDYSKPLSVNWLCQQCHNNLHYHITGLNQSLSKLKEIL